MTDEIRNSEIKEEIKNIFINLSDYLNKYQNHFVLGIYVEKFAKNLNLNFEKKKEYIYIKKGNPKILFHLSVNYNFKIKRNNILKDGEFENISNSSYRINDISSIIVLLLIMKYLHSDYEILINFNSDYKVSSLDKFDFNKIVSKNIINLNLCESNLIADSSATSHIVSAYIPFERDKVEYEFEKYRISVNNLIGGHTGIDISRIRQNSIKLIIAIIRRIKSNVDLEVCDFKGGLYLNSLPDSAYIDLIVKKEYANDLKKSFDLTVDNQMQLSLKNEPDVKFSIDLLEDSNNQVIEKDYFDLISSFIELCPSGAYSVNEHTKEIESSVNISTFKSFRNFAKVSLIFRSLNEGKLQDSYKKLEVATKVARGNIEKILYKPMWKRKENNELRELAYDVYEKLFHEPIRIDSTHESLDCAIFQEEIQDLNMLSMGVDFSKTNDGFYVEINSIYDFYLYIANILNDINS